MTAPGPDRQEGAPRSLSLGRAFATVGGLTFLSRIAGFLRDILLAALLGAGPIADAFFVALKLPNLFRRITAEGALAVSFTPLYAESRAHDPKEAQAFLDQTASWLTAALLATTLASVLFMGALVAAIAPGFLGDPVRFQAAVDLARLTFPYLLLISITALIGAALGALNRFAPFAASPLLFNSCLLMVLLGALWVRPGPADLAPWLAAAVSLAGLIQLLAILVPAHGAGCLPRLRRPRLVPRVRRLFALMGPGILGGGMVQLNILIDMLLASLLPVGAVSYLFYADRLNQLPLGVVGVALGMTLLPMLSRALAEKDTAGSIGISSRAMEIGLFFSLPSAAAFIVIAEPIILTLFQRGAFAVEDALATSAVLAAYAPGIPALILVKILATSHFARQDTRTPLIAAAISATVNIALSLVLIRFVGVLGIALATSVGAWVQAGLLYRSLARNHVQLLDATARFRIPRLAGASLAMAAVLLVLEAALVPFASMAPGLRPLLLIGLVLCGAAVYLGLCLALRAVAPRQVLAALRRSDASGAA